MAKKKKIYEGEAHLPTDRDWWEGMLKKHTAIMKDSSKPLWERKLSEVCVGAAKAFLKELDEMVEESDREWSEWVLQTLKGAW